PKDAQRVVAEDHLRHPLEAVRGCREGTDDGGAVDALNGVQNALQLVVGSFSFEAQSASVQPTSGEISTPEFLRDQAQASPSGRVAAPLIAPASSGVPRCLSAACSTVSKKSPQA